MKETVFKYFEGSATGKELEELLHWLRKKENRFIFNKFSSEWKESLEPGSFPGDGGESWQRLQAELGQKSYLRWQRTRKMINFYRVAAIFFFIMALGSMLWYYTYKPQNSHTVSETFTNVIAENGQISKVKLPDGTIVWLNSGSELTYNNFYSIENRNVTLSGEAFFDVSKNENIPMNVGCNGLQIRVLGTQFNINAYESEKFVDVVLESGSVELFDKKTSRQIYTLNPGELAKVNLQTNRFTVDKVNTNKYTSWKDGIINIYNLSMEELIVRLEKRYNQKFELTPEVKNLHYTFTIENEPLENVLKLMERITPIKVKQSEESIKIEIDKNKLR